MGLNILFGIAEWRNAMPNVSLTMELGGIHVFCWILLQKLHSNQEWGLIKTILCRLLLINTNDSWLEQSNHVQDIFGN